jgi:hypothetical protein
MMPYFSKNLTFRRVLSPVLPILASLAVLLPAPAQAGKGACAGQPIFLQEVSVRERSGIDTDEIRADYLPALENALQKKGFLLVENAQGEDEVALQVRVRAWTSRTSSKRTLLELASSVKVTEGETKLWDGDVDTGQVSRLLHGKHSDAGNLAKRTADLVAEACRSGWTLKE